MRNQNFYIARGLEKAATLKVGVTKTNYSNRLLIQATNPISKCNNINQQILRLNRKLSILIKKCVKVLSEESLKDFFSIYICQTLCIFGFAKPIPTFQNSGIPTKHFTFHMFSLELWH